MKSSSAISDSRKYAISHTIVAVVVIVLVFAAGIAYLIAYPPSSTSGATVSSNELSYTNYGATQSLTTNTTTAVTPANAVVVDIPSDNGYPFAQFTPQVITVVIGVNNTVTWTNHDVLTHNILTASGLFASGDLPTGASYTFTFTQAGTFPYYCSYHPSHTGIVIVKNA